MSYKSAITAKNDFLVDVSRSKVGDYGPLLIAGVNRDIDIASGEEDLWSEGDNLVYLTSAETMNISSTDAADTSAGTGARLVFISGVADDFTEISEVVTLNGVSNVETVNSYSRVSFMFLFSAGSGETNAGDITATASSAGTVQCFMQIGLSTTTQGFRTIGKGKAAIIKQIEIDATKITGGGGSPLVNFKVYARFPGADQAWVVILERLLDTGVQNQLIIPFPVSNVLVAGADVRLTASTDTNNTEARMRVTLIQYDA